MFLVASRPDGSVARPSLRVKTPYIDSEIKVKCDDNGIASIFLTPKESNQTAPDQPDLFIDAMVDDENIHLETTLPRQGGRDMILLRPDRGVYTVGQTMRLQVLSPLRDKEPVFLDIIKNSSDRPHTHNAFRKRLKRALTCRLTTHSQVPWP